MNKEKIFLSLEEKISFDLIKKCIQRGDIWELSDVEGQEGKIFFLQFQDGKLKMWDHNDQTIFHDSIDKLDTNYLKGQLKKLAK